MTTDLVILQGDEKMSTFDIVAGFWIVFLTLTIVVCIHDATRKK